MFSIHVKNNYQTSVFLDSIEIKPESTYSSEEISGHHTITATGLGPLNILDLGDKKIPGYDYPTQTWGVLFRYESQELYARYEGGGDFTVELDPIGEVKLTCGNGTAVEIKLPGLSLGQ